MAELRPLTADRLRVRCAPEFFEFADTEKLPDLPGGIGQVRAEEALRFGLAMRQPGYHVFVLGEPGTGRHATVFRLLREFSAGGQVPPDLCYLHNFDDAQRPRLLTLTAGRGGQLRGDMLAFIADLGPAIEAALASETYGNRVESLQDAHKTREDGALRELGEACAADGVSLLQTPDGFVFAPTKDGQAMSPEDFDALPSEVRAVVEKKVGAWSDRLADLLEQFPGWRKELHEAMKRAACDALTPAVTHLMRELRERYADLPAVLNFFDAIRKEILASGSDWAAQEGGEDEGAEDEARTKFHRYQVKLLVDHSATRGTPVVCEDNPTFGNLIGRIEHISQMGTLVTNFSLIRAGALHRACGGYLVVDVERLLGQPFAWEGLKRALRAREIRIEPPAEAQGWSNMLTLEPESIPCDVKVILVGDRELFYLLTENDPDFPELFKVAADFDEDMPRNDANVERYAALLAMLGRASDLLPFDRTGIARLVEHGARLAEDAGRLSLQTRLLADVMREADFHARAAQLPAVACAQVDAAIASRSRRFGRYAERVLESMVEGTTLISTRGARCGQINALVVVELAGEQFGHPVRITATARLGEGDVVDIERETELGGAIHSKGVLILSAFLAARYARHQPLSLSASLVFEQSYSPVEGDSASLAELCALLSALARVPIRQSFAVTGSVNQFGEVQAIGGVNEKIEGFFDLCVARGLTGEQGVVIPQASVRHLMLREDVVAAAREGLFRVHAVATVDDAMEILTGLTAGVADAKGVMPRETVNYKVAAALTAMTAAKHAFDHGSDARHARSRRRHDGDQE
ncbi:Lon protease family protein [Aromatoleum petrolei]|uniref:endopeptidase La n=1 Tax=Aromatoleum petrolei TaxID=76116 RepID=A0ABX1MNJ5_9RHOO|nr:ATP-binding protein [Aromatoleum petrolei]NMF89358.1 AAA family ATPase [Aromatoleum petrolei]QTQ35189.1 Endopeptidase La [Aromatoleum petrolei]